MKRVTKTGANSGRHHIVCVHNCGLFEWCDTFEPSSADGGAPKRSAGPTCACGHACVVKEVKKAGRNHGRQFYSCPTFPGGCGFFEWYDEHVQHSEPDEDEPDDDELDDDMCRRCREPLSWFDVGTKHKLRRAFICGSCGCDAEGIRRA